MKEKLSVTTTRKQRNLSIYLIMGWIGIFAVLVGFSKTFFIPVSQGTFVAPVTVHIHGAFAFAWVTFYLAQTFLIRKQNVRLHRSIGWAGAFIAAGVGFTMIPVGMFQVERDLRLGVGESAVSAIVGVVTGGIMFMGLVGAGFYYRRKPDIHKPLMLLATIFILWPAWFRFRHFFPSIPRPDIWFGVVLSEIFIVIAFVAEWVAKRRPNKVLLYVGAFIIVETSLEVWMFDSEGWRIVSRNVYSLLERLL